MLRPARFSLVEPPFILRYLLAGGLIPLLGLLAVYLGKWLYGLDDVIANGIGYAFAISLSLTTNKAWVFIGTLEGFYKFTAISIIGYLLNITVVLKCLLILQGNSYLAQTAGIPFYMLMSYLFRKPHDVVKAKNIYKIKLFDISALKFLVVGGANTIFGLVVIYFLKWQFDLDDIIANTIGYALGILLSFILNKRWSFQHKGATLSALIRFLLVTAIAYASNLAVVLASINMLGVNGYLAQALGIPPYTVVSYLGSRFYAFRPFPQSMRKTQ